MVVRNDKEYLTTEEQRLKSDRDRSAYWKRWGPYLSERQWVGCIYYIIFRSVALLTLPSSSLP